MSESKTLVELLVELGTAKLELHRVERVLGVAVLALPEGRRLVLLERTYREGLVALADPTDEEVEIARKGELWDLWNSERSEMIELL